MNVNIVLYDDFEVMDVFGPAEVFGLAPKHFHINYLSVRGGIITGNTGVKIWTEYLIPEEVEDILVIPGGKGVRKLMNLEPDTMQIIRESAEQADTCMMIANGSALIAQTGLLFHRKIADYPFDENLKRMFTAGMVPVQGIRWMADGKYYSSSTSSAGIDMALGVVSDFIDIDLAMEIAETMGYEWDAASADDILL